MRESEYLVLLSKRFVKAYGLSDHLSFSLLLLMINKNSINDLNIKIGSWIEKKFMCKTKLLEQILIDLSSVDICSNLKNKLEQIVLN
jgi:hypothetical protein